MTTRNTRISADKQYQLIMECRYSGLSDHQWCLEHDIKFGMFSNWVKRLCKKACYEISSATGRNDYHQNTRQEVAPVKIVPETIVSIPEAGLRTHAKSLPVLSGNGTCISAPIQIRIGSAQISITNDVDPRLLLQRLRFLGKLWRMLFVYSFKTNT